MITIDIDNVTADITPPRLRSYEFDALVDSISEPYRTILSDLYAAAAKRRYEMAFNGQVMNLRHILNDKFDNVLRRIFITNYTQGPRQYLFNKSEDNEPLYLYNKSESVDPLYLYNNDEAHYSFVIHIPSGQISNYNEFRAWVDRYKLKSKLYLIVEF